MGWGANWRTAAVIAAVLVVAGPPAGGAAAAAGPLGCMLEWDCESWVGSYAGEGTSAKEQYVGGVSRVSALSPDGKTLFVAGVVYDHDCGETAQYIGYDVATVAFDAATGAKLWSTTWDRPDAGGVRDCDYDVPNDIAVSPDGGRVAVIASGMGDFSKAVYATVVFDTSTGHTTWSAVRNDDDSDARGDMGNSLAFSGDGSRLFVTGNTGLGFNGDPGAVDVTTVAYDAANGTELWARSWDGRDGANDWMSFQSLGKSIAVLDAVIDGASTELVVVLGSDGGIEPAVIAMDAATGAVAWRYVDKGSLWAFALVGAASGIYFTGARTDAEAAPSSATVTALDPATGGLRWRSVHQERAYDEVWVNNATAGHAIALSPDGTRIAVGAQEIWWTPAFGSRVRYLSYDAATGRLLWHRSPDHVPERSGDVTSIAFTPDGASVLAAGYSSDGVAVTVVTAVIDATGQELLPRYLRYANGEQKLLPDVHPLPADGAFVTVASRLEPGPVPDPGNFSVLGYDLTP